MSTPRDGDLNPDNWSNDAPPFEEAAPQSEPELATLDRLVHRLLLLVTATPPRREIKCRIPAGDYFIEGCGQCDACRDCVFEQCAVCERDVVAAIDKFGDRRMARVSAHFAATRLQTVETMVEMDTDDELMQRLARRSAR